MGRRLTTGLAADSTLTEEMYKSEPPVMDHIKLSSTFMKQVLLVSEELDVNGNQILEFLGAPPDGGPPEWEHNISIDEQDELHEIINMLLSKIEDHFGTGEDIIELALDVHPKYKSEVEPTKEVFLIVYRKLRDVRDLIEFTIEHDIELSIG